MYVLFRAFSLRRGGALWLLIPTFARWVNMDTRSSWGWCTGRGGDWPFGSTESPRLRRRWSGKVEDGHRRPTFRELAPDDWPAAQNYLALIGPVCAAAGLLVLVINVAV